MIYVLSRLRRLRMPLLGLLALLFLLTLSACGGGSAVEVYDNARVLNVSKVQNAASSLPNPVAIYTTRTFQGTQADFQRVATQKLNGNPNLIVMAIDTSHRYLYIARGSNVPLTSAGINQAVSSFSTRFNNGDYTGASVAALQSMRTSLNENSRSRASSGGGLFSVPSLLCCILPLLLILFLVLFAASRRAGRMGGTMFRQNPFGQRRAPFGQAQPPDQEPYPEQPGQGRGMNPWLAGGLGAAAGGLAGYELGRRQGEGEPRRDEGFGGGEEGGGGSFGGDTGGGGSFGGNAPGGDDFGGGGSFGGNAPGGDDFGGGGSFGGNAPGGDDFGGGGSFGGEAGGGGSFGSDDFDQGGGGGNF
jgi:hypothetical protein